MILSSERRNEMLKAQFILICITISICMVITTHKSLSYPIESLNVQNTACLGTSSQWTHTFGGQDNDQAYSVLQTSDSGFLLGGYTRSYGAGGSDMWLVKTDQTGNTQWHQTYGGGNNENCGSIAQTSDGGFLLAGYTLSYGAGSSDIWLVKIDGTGDVEWNQTYGGGNSDWFHSLIQTSDGGFLLAGYTYSYGAGSSDMWLVKIDRTGIAEWNQTYGGVNMDECYSALQTSDGGFLLAGYTYSYGAGISDMWLVKIDRTGVAEWNQTYGGASWDECNSLIQISDGGFLLGGYTRSYGAGLTDMWLVKIDAAGFLQWHQTFGGVNTDYCESLIQTSDNGFLLAGHTTSYGVGAYDMWLVKTNETGIAEWNQTYGGGQNDRAISLIQSSDGGFLLAGYTESYGMGGSDMWLVKTDFQMPLPTTTKSEDFPGFLIVPFLITIVIASLWYKRKKRAAYRKKA